MTFAGVLIREVVAISHIGKRRINIHGVRAESVYNFRRVLLDERLRPLAEVNAWVLVQDVPCTLFEYAVEVHLILLFGNGVHRFSISATSQVPFARCSSSNYWGTKFIFLVELINLVD